MNWTKEKKLEMTMEKRNSKKTVDHLVMDELLEMGFSYNIIGTHYLHESIVISTKMCFEDFANVGNFCQSIGVKIREKYGVGLYRYANGIEAAIERAFEIGNINYLLQVFKESCNKEKMKVTKNAFIMTVRRKVMDALEEQEPINTTQLRLIIQEKVDGITDYTLLKGICDIVSSFNNTMSVKKGGAS